MSGPEEKTSQAAAEPEAGEGQLAHRGGWWRPLVLVAALLVIIVLARVFGVGERLGELRHWLITLGPWGPLAFMLIYLAATVAALPGSALGIAAGALFGSVLGVILVNIAATIGASLAFLISRYFARQAVAQWLGGNEKFRRLDRLTAEHGAIIVALTRLVPLFPFNMLNYGFGLTRVPFWTYVFWTWLCTLPGTILYVVGADAVTRAVAQGKIPWTLVAAFVVALGILTLLVRSARRRLQQKEDKSAAGQAAHPEDK
jgi:uncharacterized membrane protein YdjX (TVP38/TMEM64 family)